MKFMSTRDLRNRPGSVRKALRDDDVVLTASGKPVAVLIGVEEDELDETMELLHEMRAQRALSRLQRTSAERGVDRLSPEEIEREIAEDRSARGTS
jgi:prevent-host-death family protein